MTNIQPENIKKEKHFIDGLIDSYNSTIDIKEELQNLQPIPRKNTHTGQHFMNVHSNKGHFINPLSLVSSHFMDVHPNARELWPQSHSLAQSSNSHCKQENLSEQG